MNRKKRSRSLSENPSKSPSIRQNSNLSVNETDAKKTMVKCLEILINTKNLDEYPDNFMRFAYANTIYNKLIEDSKTYSV